MVPGDMVALARLGADGPASRDVLRNEGGPIIIRSAKCPLCAVLCCKSPKTPCRPPLPLGRAPVDAVDQHRQLRRVQHQRPTRVDVRRPKEYAVLEPLAEEAEAGAIPEHNFDEVGLPAPEHEEMAREGILPQPPLAPHVRPIDALAHVDIAEG